MGGMRLTYRVARRGLVPRGAADSKRERAFSGESRRPDGSGTCCVRVTVHTFSETTLGNVTRPSQGCGARGTACDSPFDLFQSRKEGSAGATPRGFQPHFLGHWVIAFQVGAVSCLSERMTGCPGGCRDDLIQGFEEERGGLREYCGALLCCTCMPVRVGEVCLAKPLATLLAASCRGVRTSFIRVRHALAYRFCLLPVRTHPRTSRGFPDNSSLVV